MPIERDSELRALLASARTVAVLGIKAGADDDAFRVPAYLQRVGYRVLPVNPRLERVLGEPVAASLAGLAEAPDLIDVFRAPRHLPDHVEEILALAPRPRAVWLQLGIRHPGTARLEAAGIDVVEDRCLMVEHARLLGR